MFKTVTFPKQRSSMLAVSSLTTLLAVVWSQVLGLSYAQTDLYHELSALNATKFLGLIDQAGLASFLQGPGPLTLLVPTDAAFGKVPAQDLAAVTGTPDKLQDLLHYHMIQGTYHNRDFLFMKHYYLNSTNMHVIRVLRSSTGTHFNQAVAVKTDVNCTNGVIYLINTVLDVPEGTVIDVLKKYNATKFLEIIEAAHLTRNYANPAGLNRYTVFAPSNDAISAFDATALHNLSNDTTNLRILVEYHVHSGTMHLQTLIHRTSVTTTLPAHSIAVSVTAGGGVLLDHVAHVTSDDIEAENGVVYIIDHVLTPTILSPIIG